MKGKFEVVIDWRQWMIGFNYQSNAATRYNIGGVWANVFIGPLRIGYFEVRV